MEGVRRKSQEEGVRIKESGGRSQEEGLTRRRVDDRKEDDSRRATKHRLLKEAVKTPMTGVCDHGFTFFAKYRVLLKVRGHKISICYVPPAQFKVVAKHKIANLVSKKTYLGSARN